MRNNRLVLALLIPQVAIVSAADRKPVTDDYISDAVMQRLAADAVVKGGDLKIDVKAGIVTISGSVHSLKQKDKAEHVAKKVNGVKGVVNNIKIEKP